MEQAAHLISSAISGRDYITVVVAGKAYLVESPTIFKLSGAISSLTSMQEADSLRDILLSVGDSEKYAEALSFFIRGNNRLTKALSKGTISELVAALEECLSLIDVSAFSRAVSLTKSVSVLAAKQQS